MFDTTGFRKTSENQLYCECCQQKLNPEKAVWLELNTRTGDYTKNEGECPEIESQGWFSFGAACARKILKAQQNG